MAARKSKRKSTPARRKPAPRRSAPARNAKPTSAPRRTTAAQVRPGLSLDRKLDITGVVLAVAGLLTLVSLLSTNPASLTGFWAGMWSRALGWGVYLFPLALMAVGSWLVARNFERAPQFSLERVFGFSLLFINLLVVLHLLTFAGSSEAAYQFASQGRGGGYLGAILMVLLRDGLGGLGLAIALLAWLVIALAMAFDLSVVELFRWVSPLVLRAQDWWDDRRADRTRMPAPPLPDQRDFQPIVSSSPAAVGAKTPEAVIETQPARTGVPAPQDNFGEPEKREWQLPAVAEMLDEGAVAALSGEQDEQRGRVIEETLASFGAPATVVEINRGPTITQFGVEPNFVESRLGRTRVRVGKISSLADDLALALAASRIRVEAPVPGKGYVGIEVPNEEIGMVALRNVIQSPAFERLKSPLRFALGQDVAGNAVAADLAGMPHLLIAGATGSGKSVAVNALISCLLLHNTPETLRMVMVDPKRVELTGYNGIPHLLAPVVVEIDRVVGVLQWVTREMDKRYQKFADIGARNIADFNQRMAAQNGVGAQRVGPLPYLVVVVDELADLMMIAPDQTERLITRMAQLARATGIHLVISTQRPSVDVVTGLIKANIPARIAFAVASGTDSRVILDQPGAERLLGRGDMLFQAPDAAAPVRLQGVFLSDPEIIRLVQYWRGYSGTAETAPVATSTPADAPPPNVPLKQVPIWKEIEEIREEEEKDELFDEAVDLVRRRGRASISMLQRRMRIGYTRAARLIEMMEEKEIIGPQQSGAQAREVLDYGQAAPPVGED
jgi:S-DNA-T family DNA segregation ATPase FtsK/SpoIIIE